MTNDSVPDLDHIARFCPPKTVDNGDIQATAFMLRPGEPGLSVNWLEILGLPDQASQIAQLQQIFSKKLTVSAKAKVAVLNVGQLISTVRNESDDSRELRILHRPEPDDMSHSEIIGLKHDDETIAELLRQLIQVSYPARP